MANAPELRSHIDLASRKCMESARETIRIVHETYSAHTYFQSWFYNVTYITFGASVLLLYIKHHSRDDAELFSHVSMAVAILEAMSESTVARRSAEIIEGSMRETQQKKYEMATRRNSTHPAFSPTSGRVYAAISEPFANDDFANADLNQQMYQEFNMDQNWVDFESMWDGIV